MEKLTCNARVGFHGDNCTQSVTHIDCKGWVYCSEHAAEMWGRRKRKLKRWEVALLEEGKTIPSFVPISQAEYLRRGEAS